MPTKTDAPLTLPLSRAPRSRSLHLALALGLLMTACSGDDGSTSDSETAATSESSSDGSTSESSSDGGTSEGETATGGETDGATDGETTGADTDDATTGAMCLSCNETVLQNAPPSAACDGESSTLVNELVACLCQECGANDGDPCFNACTIGEQPDDACLACDQVAFMGACMAQAGACFADQ
ncbi:MAG: hypothetical protein KC468_22775 [Myxococcales bacterium]|nr:hypothetical protein [Myxococcales bacterium]